MSLHPTARRVQDALRALGCQAQVIELGESTGTSQEAARALGVEVGQIGKSLVFLADEKPILVVASGANRVDTGKLGRIVGATVRRADPDTVKVLTGFPVGGVPPVGHAQPMEIFIDQDIFQYDVLYCAGGTPHAIFPIAPQELLRITGGHVADIREERSRV